jgi:cytochrome c oxidase subunit 1/cytochrome c oxidase subunit I+III
MVRHHRPQGHRQALRRHRDRLLVVGGVEALLIRLQLARPDQAVLTPEAYDQIFSMHGITMIYWYAAPILSGFANYLIPLMQGSRDMACPRTNAFS